LHPGRGTGRRRGKFVDDSYLPRAQYRTVIEGGKQ
jgi:hypothetical protein